MVLLEYSGLNRNDYIKKISSTSIFCYEKDYIKSALNKVIVGYRRLPVVNKNNEVVGILTSSDLLKAFLLNMDFEREKVENIMFKQPLVVKESDTIEFLLKLFILSKRGGFPVVDKNYKLKGIVSERDLIKFFENVPFGKNIEEVMTKKPLCINLNFSLHDCAKSFLFSGFRRFPVIDKERKLIGLVTISDLLKYIYEHNLSDKVLEENVEKILIKDVLTISKNKDLSEFIKLTKDKYIGGLVVTDEKNVVEGIVTERDIIKEIE